MHLSMLSPRGGTPGICGAFDLFCLPHPREFDLESGPQGGDVCFFLRGGLVASHVCAGQISVAQGAFRFCIRLRKIMISDCIILDSRSSTRSIQILY